MRKTELGLFAFLFGTFAFFAHREPGWNVNSRFCLTVAIVDAHSVRIDDLARETFTQTEDVSVFGGHVYSDKVIGTALAGVPAYQIIRWAERVSGRALSVSRRRYLTTVFSVGLFASWSAVLLFRLLMMVSGGTQPIGALVLVALSYFGTQQFLYSTLFMGYLPSICFLLWAIWRFESWRLLRPNEPPPLVVCGLLLGLAILFELTAGIAVACWILYMFARVRIRDGWRIIAGVAVGIAPFVIYCVALFGRLRIPYQYSELFREPMSRGLMGATWPPQMIALAAITVLPYRGLFIHSSFLIVSAAGCVAMARDAIWRNFSFFVGLTTILYLTFNACYFLWWGGFSFGPRHVMFVTPLLTIPLIRVWHHRLARALVIALGLASVFLHLVVNAVDAQPSDLTVPNSPEQLLADDRWTWGFPLRIWPAFRSGHLDTNLGQGLGLAGAWSLIPLVMFWIAMGWYLTRRLKSTSAARA